MGKWGLAEGWVILIFLIYFKKNKQPTNQTNKNQHQMQGRAVFRALQKIDGGERSQCGGAAGLGRGRQRGGAG